MVLYIYTHMYIHKPPEKHIHILYPTPKLSDSRRKAKDTKTIKGPPHRSEAFADNLTAISTDIKEHQSLLDHLDQRCQELNLYFKPSKCTSFLFDGNSAIRQKTMSIHVGRMRNVCSKPTSFLGKIIGSSNKTTRKHATLKLR